MSSSTVEFIALLTISSLNARLLRAESQGVGDRRSDSTTFDQTHPRLQTFYRDIYRGGADDDPVAVGVKDQHDSSTTREERHAE